MWKFSPGQRREMMLLSVGPSCLPSLTLSNSSSWVRQNFEWLAVKGRYGLHGGQTTQLCSKECSLSARAERRDDIGSTVRALQSRNRFPRKHLGQHYMVSEKVNAEVVDAGQIKPGDVVVEIGPGTGSLTKALVDAGATVIAIEKDPDMASLVIERFEGTGRVKSITGGARGFLEVASKP